MPESVGVGPIPGSPDDEAAITRVMAAGQADAAPRPSGMTLNTMEKLRFAMWLIEQGPDQMIVVKNLVTRLLDEASQDLIQP